MDWGSLKGGRGRMLRRRTCLGWTHRKYARMCGGACQPGWGKEQGKGLDLVVGGTTPANTSQQGEEGGRGGVGGWMDEG